MNPINVTQLFLPPIEEFQEYLKQIWDSKWLTNNGQTGQETGQETEGISIKLMRLIANNQMSAKEMMLLLNLTGRDNFRKGLLTSCFKSRLFGNYIS